LILVALYLFIANFQDMRFALGLGDQLGLPLPICAAANNHMIAARARGHGDDDFSATYEAVGHKPGFYARCLSHTAVTLITLV